MLIKMKPMALLLPSVAKRIPSLVRKYMPKMDGYQQNKASHLSRNITENSSVSIVIPILSEADNLSSLVNNITELNPAPQHVIFVDGGSKDCSIDVANTLIERLRADKHSAIKWKIISSAAGRATQMNIGAALATEDILLFLHADTQLPNDAIDDIIRAMTHAEWGRFDVRLDSPNLMLEIVSRMMNGRSRLTGIATGDQAIFIKSSLFKRIGGYAQQPLMEDIELCKRLKSMAKPACLTSKVITSARRWQLHGTWRTIWLMWHLRFDYWRGVSADNIKQRYYKSEHKR